MTFAEPRAVVSVSYQPSEVESPGTASPACDAADTTRRHAGNRRARSLTNSGARASRSGSGLDAKAD